MMRKSHSKSGLAKWKVYSVLIALVLVVIAGFLIVSNWRILGKTMDSIRYRNAAEVNLKNISDREATLNAKLKELETDTGLDKEIRERFPVAKPGEEVIMIVPGNEATSDSSVSSGSWWDKLMNFFKN